MVPASSVATCTPCSFGAASPPASVVCWSLAFGKNGSSGFVAAQMCPVIPVTKQSDRYYTYNRGGFFRDQMQKRAPALLLRASAITDDKGTHAVALTKSAWESIIDTMQKKLQAFKDHFALENKKALADYLKDEEEAAHRLLEREAKRYQERLKNDVDISEKNLEHLRQAYSFEEQRAGFERDASLREVEGVDAVTLQQKIAVEQQKAAIEIDYLQKVHEVKQALYLFTALNSNKIRPSR